MPKSPGLRAVYTPNSLTRTIQIFDYNMKAFVNVGINLSTQAKRTFTLTFCASSCLSKLTNPNPLDFPLSSVITFTLKAGPERVN